MTEIAIEGGRALIGGEIVETSLRISGGAISAVGSRRERGAFGLDARGLLVLPGIVDLHGDAFERQLMPRPGVDFPVDVALAESDRQAISNGITSLYHAVTWSWEPGLRSGNHARLLLEAIEMLRPQLAADTRFHLRHETYNLDAEDEIIQWLNGGRIDLLAFNDHMLSTVASSARPRKRAIMVERSGLSSDAFEALVARVVARSVGELAEILQRLTVVADSSTSVLLETIIPLRNPIPTLPAQQTAATAKRPRARERVRA